MKRKPVVTNSYYAKNPQKPVAVLLPNYYQAYYMLQRTFTRPDMEFTARDVTKLLRTLKPRRCDPLRALYLLFGRKVLIAVDPRIDEVLRRPENMWNRFSGWTAVPPRTKLKFNPDASTTLIPNKAEIRITESFLTKCTSADGEIDIVMAADIIEKTKGQLMRLERTLSLQKKCFELL